MSIDTEITGSPGGIEGAATWLRNSLEPRLTAAADAANAARRDAETGWSSVAGEEFVGTVHRDEEDGDVSYSIQIVVLAEDLAQMN